MLSDLLSNNFCLDTQKCDFNKHTIKTYNTINIVQVFSYKIFLQCFFLVILINQLFFLCQPIQCVTTIQNWYEQKKKKKNATAHMNIGKRLKLTILKEPLLT